MEIKIKLHSLGDYLRLSMIQAAVTQKELCSELDIKQPTLSRWLLEDNAIPNGLNFVLLADFFADKLDKNLEDVLLDMALLTLGRQS